MHAIGFMPQDGLGGNFLNTPWESVAFGFQTSAFSLKAMGTGLLEPMKAAGGASLVSLTFDGRFAWPIYDWMGVAKAGLEAVTRYLARDLGEHGIRVNTVNPDAVIADSGIWSSDWKADRASTYGVSEEDLPTYYRGRTRLGVNVYPEDVAEAIAFFAGPRSNKSTGNVVNVDGGVTAAYPR